jgi:hypothetical protein
MQKLHQKCLENFEMWCWRQKEISQLNKSCEKLRSPGRKKHPTYNKMKEG